MSGNANGLATCFGILDILANLLSEFATIGHGGNNEPTNNGNRRRENEGKLYERGRADDGYFQ